MIRPRIGIVAVLAGFALAASAGSAMAAPPSVLVTETALTAGSLPMTVTAFGRVRAPSVRVRTLTAPVAAMVAMVAVRPGQKVAAGAPLLRLAPDPQSSAAFAQAQAAVTAADSLVRHTERLAARFLATHQQVVEAERRQADAGAALHALVRQGAGGPRPVRAPVAGIVTALAVEPGAHVTAGSRLLTLAPGAGLVLGVGLVPHMARAVKRGDFVRIRPTGGGGSVSGRVVFRGALVDGDGLVPVDIAVPAGALLPGQMAKAAIVTGMARGYVVPHAALLIGDDGHPYVVQAVAGVAKRVMVSVLASRDGRDVIAGDLDPAAPLVLSGNHQLGDGMRVRLAPASGGR